MKLWRYCSFTVSICLVAGFSAAKSDINVAESLSSVNDKLLKDIKSFEVVKPYRLEGRRKRHVSTKQSSGHVQDTTLVFGGQKKRFALDISLNKGLFGRHYQERYVSDDGPRYGLPVPHEHCFYHGTVQGQEDSVVSLSTCYGIEGVIRTKDETYFISPLKSSEGKVLEDHILYNADDVVQKPAYCGHSSHKRSADEQIDYKRHEDKLRRSPRSIESETKYLEMFIINDHDQFRKWRDRSAFRAKTLVNHLDSIYRAQNIRIALVDVETWDRGDLFDVNLNASTAYNNFVKYKQERFDKHNGRHFDNVQLLTGKEFHGTTVGYAGVLSICGKGSAAVVQDTSPNPAFTASIMAHELGHNFGMNHDENTCLCNVERCIMSAKLIGAVTSFSKCSVDRLAKTLNEGYGVCLTDEPKKLHGEPICNNGFVEEGEQCDCGTPEECGQQKCCNVTTCMLLPGAACSHGECCTADCQFRSQGHTCREKHDSCDLPEHCTGETHACPEDSYNHDGLPCDNGDGYCYGGVCRSLRQQCEFIFGKGVHAGADICFERNSQKGNVGTKGCKNERQGQFACKKEDIKCGRIHCTSSTADPTPLPKIGNNRGHWWISRNRTHFCVVPYVSIGDGIDPEYVFNGTKCGDGMMCINSKCIPLSQAIPRSPYDRCPYNCSGHGVCNNNGNCHCDPGYACPDCAKKGSDKGGSTDSGQGCGTKGKGGGVNVAAAVLIPLFLLLIIAIAFVVYIKRRTIRERLSRYKFVRRSVSRSASPSKTRNQSSHLHSGLISNPQPVDQPIGKTRRVPAPPTRPTAYLVENEQPDPMSTPQAHVRAVPKPPPGTVSQPRGGHQSVPLYPPSVAPDPVPEVAVKPRPSAPTRPFLVSNLPRTPSAPSSAPNRPKLPPSGPPPDFKSVPDLPSATKPKAPPSTSKANVVPPRPKPRLPPSSHNSVPEFPDDVPVAKPRNIAPRPGHQSVPLFNLPDNSDSGSSVKPSAVKANQAKLPPPRKPPAQDIDNGNRVDFRAGLKPVPKPWEKS